MAKLRVKWKGRSVRKHTNQPLRKGEKSQMPKREPATDAFSSERLHEAEKTLRNATFLLLVGCLYSVTVLLKGDVILIDRNATVNLPLNSGEISFDGFLLFGPIVLCGVWLYQQLFRQYVEEKRSHGGLPFFFNLPMPIARAITGVLFYGLAPATLAFFWWRASPRSVSPYLAGYLAIGIGFAIYQCLCKSTRLRFPLPISCILTIGIAVILVNSPPRRLDLRGADLEGLDLRSQYLQRASFDSFTNLKKADLRGTNLSGADLSEVNLAEARLSSLICRSCSFAGADMAGVDLTKADLCGADLNGANLAGANLTLTILSDLSTTIFPSTLSESTEVIIEQDKYSLCVVTYLDGMLQGEDCQDGVCIATLSSTDLHNAKLNHAIMTGVPIDKAILDRADFKDASIGGLANWKQIRSMEKTLFLRVKNSPPGFLDWAKDHGAIVEPKGIQKVAQ